MELTLKRAALSSKKSSDTKAISINFSSSEINELTKSARAADLKLNDFIKRVVLERIKAKQKTFYEY